jgi:transcriptional repressor NrdR
MHCPFCGAPDTKVIDSRLADDGAQVRRRRVCGQCEGRFTTYEVAELLMPRVIKNDGVRAMFDEGKLRLGMQHALQKRPVASEAVEAAIGRIRRTLQELGLSEVPSRQIGELVMDELRGLDQVAYVRFASVYRHFEDVNAFRDEVDRLQGVAEDDSETGDPPP